MTWWHKPLWWGFLPHGSSPLPANTYILEDESDYYVTEDGTSPYVTEA